MSQSSQIILGIGRTLVMDDGSTFQLQRREDIFRIKAPRADEFLSRIFLIADGLPLLDLPVITAASMTNVLRRM